MRRKQVLSALLAFTVVAAAASLIIYGCTVEVADPGVPEGGNGGGSIGGGSIGGGPIGGGGGNGGGGGGDDLASDVPAPAGAQTLGGVENCRGGLKQDYTVNQSPQTTVSAYAGQLRSAGWSIDNEYANEFGGNIEASKGGRFLKLNTGGNPISSTKFINLCVWPSRPSDTNCGNCNN